MNLSFYAGSPNRGTKGEKLNGSGVQLSFRSHKIRYKKKAFHLLKWKLLMFNGTFNQRIEMCQIQNLHMNRKTPRQWIEM